MRHELCGGRWQGDGVAAMVGNLKRAKPHYRGLPETLCDYAAEQGNGLVTTYEENKNVLRDIEARGTDLSHARLVDFSFVFHTEKARELFVQACADLAFNAVDTTDEEMDHFDITVSKTMIPTCDNITEVEELLGNLANDCGGKADGWGFFSE